MSARRTLALFLAPLALAACGGGSDADRNLDSLDAELSGANSSGRAQDPAITAALRDQIMVDPQLAAQSNRDAVRPPSRPYSAPVPDVKGAPSAPTDARTSEIARAAPAPGAACPRCAGKRDALTLGGLAARQPEAAMRRCAAGLSYSARWALRLPAALPLYPDARLTEAAGNADGGCGLRIASFTSEASVQSVIDWYYARATAAGYAAEHQADGDGHVLAGNHGDAAFALFVSRRDDGVTQVDLVANQGR